MAQTLKVLGQLNPAATTLTALYTVPSATATSISTLIVCNQAATSGTFRITVAVAGAGLSAIQYLFYDEPIGPSRGYPITLGITLAASDVINIYSSSATMSFNLFGVEVT